MGLRLTHLIPAHVRHLQALAQVSVAICKAHHLARKYAQALNTAIFFAMTHQCLHANTDTQKRGATADNFTYCLIQPTLVQLSHTVTDSAHTRKDNSVGSGNHCRVRGDYYLLTTSDFLKRFRHGVQVTHTVIKDGDGLSHNQPFSVSVPLVDGVMFAIRSSASTAMRRARPNALNTVSAWWCAFLPRKLSMCTVSMPWLTMP